MKKKSVSPTRKQGQKAIRTGTVKKRLNAIERAAARKSRQATPQTRGLGIVRI